MDMDAILAQARDTVTVKRVFGEPIERDGSLIIPVAMVAGGGGGGTGSPPDRPGETGSGGGFGVWARPLGVYVVRDGRVDFRPALDTTVFALAGAFLLSRLMRGRTRRRRS